MASEGSLLLGLNRDLWTPNLLRGTIQELVRENYNIELELELDQPWDTRPVLMHRLDNLLRKLTPESVDMFTERLRQRNWGLGDVVRDKSAATLIAAGAAYSRTAVGATRVQSQIRLTTQSAEEETRRGIEADGLRGRILELENTATTQEIEKAALENLIKELEKHLATRNRQNLPSHVSMLENSIISMQEENRRFEEGTVGI